MFTIAIVAEKEREKRILWETVSALSFEKLFVDEIDLLWFTKSNAMDEIGKYGARYQLALVCKDGEKGVGIGRAIYRNNPECMLCFIGRDSRPNPQLLQGRPFEYYCQDYSSPHWDKAVEMQKKRKTSNDGKNYLVDETLAKRVLQMMLEYQRSAAYFYYSNRRMQLFLPARDICYFESHLREVRICCTDGREETVLSKLNDIEGMLRNTTGAACFLRVHQSYLVNLLYLERIDRSAKEVCLKNGERLRISEANYEKVLRIAEQLKSGKP